MSGNLGVSPATSSRGPQRCRSTADHDRKTSIAIPAGFAALLTFPGMNFLEPPLLATLCDKLFKVVAGVNPATNATLAVRVL